MDVQESHKELASITWTARTLDEDLRARELMIRELLESPGHIKQFSETV